MGASAVRIAGCDPRRPDARFCLRSYFGELARRFDGGFDPARSISADDDELTPPAGLLLVATLHGEPVGCGALKFHPGAPTEIKRMWVAPDARGLGLGRHLLASLEERAADAGASCVRLETNGSLPKPSRCTGRPVTTRYPRSATSRTPITGSRKPWASHHLVPWSAGGAGDGR